MMETYFKLYAYNIPVRGDRKSAIYNLQFAGIKLIPNSLYDILQLTDAAPFHKVRERYAGDDLRVFDQYFQMLLEEGLGFFTTTPESFPKLDLEWKYPGVIQTCVMEYPLSVERPAAVIDELEALGCRFLEIRLHQCAVDELEALLEYASHGILRCIELVGAYSPYYNEKKVVALFEKYPKIGSIVIYGAPFSRKLANGKVVYTTKSSPINIPLNKYYVNISFFTESLMFNTYYNRKVCIAENGDIKNCLRLAQAFGNVATDKLSAVVRRADFQQLWHAAPDKITGLKDSELRYAIYPAVQLEVCNDETYKIID